MERYWKASEFAKKAHAGVTRRFTGEPYWNHPHRVAMRVAALAHHSDTMVEAAYLHDVLEDTDVSEYEMWAEFGSTVLGYVKALTKPSTAFGNRATRKAKMAMTLAAAPNEVKTIKLSDLLDNGPSLREHDPEFWKVYRAETMVLLPALKGGDIDLYAEVELMLAGF